MVDNAGTINEVISLEFNPEQFKQGLEKAKQAYNEFLEHLNKTPANTGLQNLFNASSFQRAFEQIKTFSNQIKSEFAQAAQAAQQTADAINQVAMGQGKVADKTKQVEVSLSKGQRTLGQLIKDVAFWHVLWSATGEAINLAFLPFRLFLDGLKQGFTFLENLQTKVADVRDLLIQSVSFSSDINKNFELATKAATRLALEQEVASSQIGARVAQFRNVFEGLVSAGGLKGLQQIGKTSEQVLSDAVRVTQLIISGLNAVGVGEENLRLQVTNIGKLIEGTTTARDKIRIASGLTNQELNKQSLEMQKQGRLLEFIEGLFKAQVKRISTSTERFRDLNAQVLFFRERLQATLVQPIFDRTVAFLQQTLAFLKSNQVELTKFAQQGGIVLNEVVSVASTLGKSLLEVTKSIFAVIDGIINLTARFTSLAEAGERFSAIKILFVGFLRGLIAVENILDRIKTDFEIIADEAKRLGNADLKSLFAPDNTDEFRKQLAQREELEAKHQKELERLRENEKFLSFAIEDAKLKNKIDVANELVAKERDSINQRLALERKFAEETKRFQERQAAAEAKDSSLVVARLRKRDEDAAKERLKLITQFLSPTGKAETEKLPPFITKPKDAPEVKHSNEQLQDSLRQFRQDSESIKAQFSEIRDSIALDIAAGETSAAEGARNIVKAFESEKTALTGLADSFIADVKRIKGAATAKDVERFLDQIRLAKIKDEESARKSIAKVERDSVAESIKLEEDKFRFVQGILQSERKARLEELKFLAEQGFALHSEAIANELDGEKKSLESQLEISDREFTLAGRNEKRLQEAEQNRTRAITQSQERQAELSRQATIAREREAQEVVDHARRLQEIQQRGVEDSIRISEEEFTTEKQRAANAQKIRQSRLEQIGQDLAYIQTQLIVSRALGKREEALSDLIEKEKELRAIQANAEKENRIQTQKETPSTQRNVLEVIFGRGKDNNAFEGLDDVFSQLKEGAQSAASVLGSLSNAVSGVISRISSGFAQGGVLGGIGAIASTVGELIPGIGGAIAQIAGQITQLFGSLFARAARKMAERLQKGFDAINKEIDRGNISLAEGIRQLEAKRIETIKSLSGTKGGSKELAKILPSIEDQIFQLKAQQKTIIDSFETDLALLELGSDELRNVKREWLSINEQVKKYIDAGGDLEKANQFLSLSLQDIQQNAIDAFAEAEKQAIDDALALQDLLTQRIDLIKEAEQAQRDFNEQVFNLQNDSAIEKRVSGSVKAGLEVAKLREKFEEDKTKRAERLQDLDREIGLKTQIVNKERTLFNLASDTAGLKARSAALDLASADSLLSKWQDIKSVIEGIRFDPATSLASLSNGFASRIGASNTTISNSFGDVIVNVTQPNATPEEIGGEVSRVIRQQFRMGLNPA